MFFKGLITSMAVLLTIGRSYTGEWEGRFLFLTSLSLRLIFISLILYKITIIIILIVIIISFLILCCHFVILFSLLCLTSFAVCLLFYYYYYFFFCVYTFQPFHLIFFCLRLSLDTPRLQNWMSEKFNGNTIALLPSCGYAIGYVNIYHLAILMCFHRIPWSQIWPR